MTGRRDGESRWRRRRRLITNSIALGVAIALAVLASQQVSFRRSDRSAYRGMISQSVLNVPPGQARQIGARTEIPPCGGDSASGPLVLVHYESLQPVRGVLDAAAARARADEWTDVR